MQLYQSNSENKKKTFQYKLPKQLNAHTYLMNKDLKVLKLAYSIDPIANNGLSISKYEKSNILIKQQSNDFKSNKDKFKKLFRGKQVYISMGADSTDGLRLSVSKSSNKGFTNFSKTEITIANLTGFVFGG